MARKQGSKSRPRLGPQRPADSEWIISRMRERGVTQRQLADALITDQSGVFHRLSGERRWQIPEIMASATLLGVPTLELMRRLGYDISEPPIAVAGRVTATGQISALRAGLVGSIDIPGMPETARAIEVERMPAGPMAAFGGAYIIYDAAANDSDAYGRLAVIAAGGELVPVIGWIEKRHETVMLNRLDGALIPVNTILAVHPVLMVIWPKN